MKGPSRLVKSRSSSSPVREPQARSRAKLTIDISGDQFRITSARRGHREVICVRDLPEPASRPILKWAGGKQWLAPAARLLMPPGFAGRYWEPFLGGGAFFFAL